MSETNNIFIGDESMTKEDQEIGREIERNLCGKCGEVELTERLVELEYEGYVCICRERVPASMDGRDDEGLI